MRIFIDESGDHNLDPTKVDNIYNVFVLSAVCFTEDAYNKFDTNFNELKRNLFDTDNIILHTAEITRPSKSKNKLNERFNDRNFRASFYKEMNTLIARAEFNLVTCAVRKNEMFSVYGENTEDPYIFSFNFLLNRLLRYCRDGNANIYPEKRGFVPDANLELAMLHAKTAGTRFYKGVEVSRRVTEFVLKDKKENLSGLQLADLVATPIGRHVLGREPKPAGNEITYADLKEKIRHGDFAVFPTQ